MDKHFILQEKITTTLSEKATLSLQKPTANLINLKTSYFGDLSKPALLQ